jgi:hypothetical protein
LIFASQEDNCSHSYNIYLPPQTPVLALLKEKIKLKKHNERERDRDQRQQKDAERFTAGGMMMISSTSCFDLTKEVVFSVSFPLRTAEQRQEQQQLPSMHGSHQSIVLSCDAVLMINYASKARLENYCCKLPRNDRAAVEKGTLLSDTPIPSLFGTRTQIGYMFSMVVI